MRERRLYSHVVRLELWLCCKIHAYSSGEQGLAPGKLGFSFVYKNTWEFLKDEEMLAKIS